jgi:UDP-glucose 4-epimerase
MEQILLTGATGLIGSETLEILGCKGAVIHTVGRHAPSRPDFNIEHHSVDLSTSWGRSTLPRRINRVIHLAQSEHFRDFPEKSEDVFSVNVSSTLRLLEYARSAGASHFVLASSGGIYGYGDHEFSEDGEISALGDIGFYLGTKLCSEILAQNYTPFMNISILRFFFVYGPKQKRSMLIPRLVDTVRLGRPVMLQGQDGLRINPTHVSDAARAVCHAASLDGNHRINVGGPQAMSLRDVAEVIGGVLGIRPVFEVSSGAQPRHLVGDIAKMTSLLGPPQVLFEQGVRELVRL